VTGDLTPDVTGDYREVGNFQGKRYYYSPETNWYIWWDGVDKFWLSDELGVLAGPHWRHPCDEPHGIYTAQGGAIGAAGVEEI